VNSVSETIYSPTDLQRKLDIPIQTQEPTYRVRIELDKQYVLNGDNRVKLQNGMSMIADIEYDRRSLIEWLFSPLLSVKWVQVK
jgi:membrane fusion protein